MANQRRNNPQDMNVREQIEKIQEDLCEMVCKYYQSATDKINAIKGNDQTLRQEIIGVCQKELARHCEQCPLKRL